MNIRIVQAKQEQAQLLSELALRSKAYWNYSGSFMQAVTAELTYTAEDLKIHPTFVAEEGERVVGFYQLVALDSKEVELEAMFVDPDYLRNGVGVQLFTHATQVAKGHGFKIMKVQSDPNATDFYLRQGCDQLGESASLSIPGRYLPLLEYKL